MGTTSGSDTFTATGGFQRWTAPAGLISLSIIVGGGNGGGAGANLGGGHGDIRQGDWWATLPTTLDIYVGEDGQFSGPGGWPDGGAAGASSGSGGRDGAGGGGSSSVVWNGNIVIQAGGGGGSGNISSTQSTSGLASPYSLGGNGGYPSGGSGFARSVTGVGTGGGGGTQGIGGTGGTQVGVAGYAGGGGAGGNASSANAVSGGGGGGGYYGGGGGGSSTKLSAGGGGGSGSYDPAFITNFSAGVGSSGQVVISYTYSTQATWTGVAPLAATGHMSVSGTRIPTDIGTPSIQSHAAMSVASAPIPRSYPLALIGHAALAVSTPPTPHSSTLSMSALGGLSIHPVQTHLSSEPMSAIAMMTTVLGDLGIVSINTSARMSLASISTLSTPNAMSARLAMVLSVLNTTKQSLSIPIRTSMVIDALHIISQGQNMAAKGSVSLVETISALGGLSVPVRAQMTVQGHQNSMASLVAISVASTMVLTNPIFHPYTLKIDLSTAMQIAALKTDVISLRMAPYAQMLLHDTGVSNTIEMLAVFRMLIDNEPNMVLDPPYLYVYGPPADMAFFIGNWPNRGQATQVVKNDYNVPGIYDPV